MTEDQRNGHPDEGTIHAWLDGELAADESARVEAHVAECAACSERVAEARGLIAGASRVVGMLDDVPTPTLRPAPSPAVTPTSGGSLWRVFRVTPTRAAIAAALLVAVGMTLTRKHVAVESIRVTDSSLARAERVAVAPAPVHDSVLGAAVARRLEEQQPQRTVEAAPGPGVAVPPTGGIAPPAPDARDEIKVATARASVQAQRESVTALPDRARAGVAAAAPGFTVPAERTIVAAKAADSAGFTTNALMGNVGRVVIVGLASSACYRVEGAPGATWGPVALPMVLAVDETGKQARVLALDGKDTEARSTVVFSDADSVVLRLRRIGYSGVMRLAGVGDLRSGAMRSSPMNLQLSEITTTAVGAAPLRTAKAAPPPPTPVAGEAATAVTAHRVGCPSP